MCSATCSPFVLRSKIKGAPVVPGAGVGLVLVAVLVVVAVTASGAAATVVPLVGLVPVVPLDGAGAAPVPGRVTPVEAAAGPNELGPDAPRGPGRAAPTKAAQAPYGVGAP